MATAPRIIGIILCAILMIASLAFLTPAAIGLIAIGLIETNKGKGTRLGLAFASRKDAPIPVAVLSPITSLLEARMKLIGASKAIIEPSQARGEDLQVLLPPGTGVKRAALLLTSVGLMELKLVAKNTSVPYAAKEEAEEDARELGVDPGEYEVAIYRPLADTGVEPTEGWVIIEKRPVITGAFTQRSAEDLAIVLNTGSLPRPLQVVSEQTFDAGTWSGGYTKRILISGAGLLAVLAFLYKLARARPAPAEVYWPEAYGQSS